MIMCNIMGGCNIVFSCAFLFGFICFIGSPSNGCEWCSRVPRLVPSAEGCRSLSLRCWLVREIKSLSFSTIDSSDLKNSTLSADENPRL